MFDAFDRQLTDGRLSYSALSALFVGGFGKMARRYNLQYQPS